VTAVGRDAEFDESTRVLYGMQSVAAVAAVAACIEGHTTRTCS
jgi:hypothetical protein